MKLFSYFRVSFLVLLTFFVLPVFAQEDSTELDAGIKHIVYYKTYEEYLQKTPSATGQVRLKYVYSGPKRSILIAVKPGEMDRKIWGFSDGENTFVKFMGSVIGHRFWKLQCDGPNPYIFYKQKTILATGGGITAAVTLAASAAVPAMHSVMVVTKSGKIKEATKKNLRKIFAGSPSNLEALEKAAPLNQKEKMQLIRDFNTSQG